MKKLVALPFAVVAVLLVLVGGILVVMRLLAPAAATAPAVSSPAGKTIVGSGRVQAEARPVSNFTAVTLAGPGDLTIRYGDVEALTVEAEDNLLPLVDARVHDHTLTLSLQAPNPQDTLKPTRAIRYDLTVRSIGALSTSGPGSISVPAIRADRLRVTISGAGTVSMTGAVASQEITIEGSGQYRAGDLESREAQVKVLGSGVATLWVHDRLAVNCTGACVVKHYGSPTVTKDLTPAGAVAWLGDR